MTDVLERPRFKLGSILPEQAHIDASLQGADYLDLNTLLPKIPKKVGHAIQFPADGGGMLGNDVDGDCVPAGGCHEHELTSALGGNTATFTTADALALYTALTGFDPHAKLVNGVNPTDKGTDPLKAAKYRQKTGIKDADGNVHKILYYFILPTGDIDALRACLYLFDIAGVCWDLPESAQEQFQSGKWTVVDGSPIEGGHYTAAIGDDGEWTEISTWGGTVKVQREFYKKYNSLTIGYLTEESLKDGKSLEGFNLKQLEADYVAVTKVK